MNGDRHEQLRREFHRVFSTDGLSEVDIRDRVLDVFLGTEQHVGVEELMHLLIDEGMEITAEQVRKHLELFTAYGIARKQRFESVGERWEHLHLGMHHDHMVCVQCGKILEFECPEMEALQLQVARQHNFRTAHHKMVIYGVCDACNLQRAAGFPLSHTATGEMVEVQKLRGPVALWRRLDSMGLKKGSVIEVMLNEGSGPIIVARGDTRLGVDRDVARRLMVVPFSGSEPPPPPRHCRRRHRKRRHV